MLYKDFKIWIFPTDQQQHICNYGCNAKMSVCHNSSTNYNCRSKKEMKASYQPYLKPYKHIIIVV